jgi:cytoplasmic tRNA 2-thiolation protein 1
MPPRNCAFCDKARAIIRRPKTGDHVCKECFFWVFEMEVHNTITTAKLFKAGEKVAIGASGGKGRNTSHSKRFRLLISFFNLDSTVLAYVMKTLNERYKYGLELFLLSIDEGITGYRDDSLEVGAPIPVYCPAPHGIADRQAQSTTV